MRKLMLTGCGLVAAYIAFCAVVVFSRDGDVALALVLLTIDALAVEKVWCEFSIGVCRGFPSARNDGGGENNNCSQQNKN